MSVILGIDPSLTGTGLARIDTDDVLTIETWTIASKGKADATLAQRCKRLQQIAGTISLYDADLVVIESPSLGQARQGGTLDRNGLWWLIVDGLYSRPIVDIAPSTLKVYATGKGNASKGAVIEAATRRYSHVATDGDDNRCDALVLAAIGHHLLTGKALVDLPLTHTRALDKVARPGVAA